MGFRMASGTSCTRHAHVSHAHRITHRIPMRCDVWRIRRGKKLSNQALRVLEILLLPVFELLCLLFPLFEHPLLPLRKCPVCFFGYKLLYFWNGELTGSKAMVPFSDFHYMFPFPSYPFPDVYKQSTKNTACSSYEYQVQNRDVSSFKYVIHCL